MPLFMGADIGDLVTFHYNNVSKGVHDRTPLVLVLHTDWLCYTRRDISGLKHLGNISAGKRCFHGLNWGLLDQSERNYLRGVMNPSFGAELAKTDLTYAKKLETVQDMPSVSITSPQDFYDKIIRPFIKPKGWEPYRRYRKDRMQGIRVVMSRALLAGPGHDTYYQSVMRRLSALRGPVLPHSPWSI